MEQVEGFYEDGKIELKKVPLGLETGPVQVIILPAQTQPATPRLLEFGKYSGAKQSTEDDFHDAEWRGEKWPPSL
jgi:hypothetical protein